MFTTKWTDYYFDMEYLRRKKIISFDLKKKKKTYQNIT